MKTKVTKSKTEQLNELFTTWRSINTLPGLFIEDGLIDEYAWIRSSKRIVVLLKEPSNTDANASEWKYQDFIKDKGYLREKGTTWPNLIRWTFGLLHNFPSFIEVENNYREIRESAQNFFKSVCFVNVKKIAGATSAVDQLIRKASDEGRTLLLQQMKILEPNIILCCGSLVFDEYKTTLINETEAFEEKISPGGLQYIWMNNLRTIVINYHHPMAYIPKSMSYTFLMEEVRKIT